MRALNVEVTDPHFGCRCKLGAYDDSQGARLGLTYEANTTCHKDLAALHSTDHVHSACVFEPYAQVHSQRSPSWCY